MKYKKEEDSENQDAVHLPELFGIKPGKYLAALYALIILAVLFFVFVYPGITRPGSKLIVESEPWGAAIRVDDVYYAAAPAQFFVPAGKRTITAILPGFEPFQTEVEVGNRLFASLFFPPVIQLKVKLTEKNPLAALTLGAEDYAAWTFAGEPTEDYQIPLSLSEGAYRSAPPSGSADTLLKSAARFMVTQAALKDLFRAEFLSSSGGVAASPLAALAAVRDIFRYMNENPPFAIAIADILPEKTAGKLIESSFYPEVWIENGEPAYFPTRGASFSVEGILFGAEFSANTYTQNSAFQHKEAVGPFFIALDEISEAVWQRFLAVTPEWRAENSAALIEKQLVTADYLEPFSSPAMRDSFFQDNPEYPAPSMSGISWFAASAFCRWLTAKLPAELAGAYEVRLPTEAEWEYAAKLVEQAGVKAGVPRRMIAQFAGRSGELTEKAGLWEWCADAYAPLNYLAAPQDGIASPERSVRGGSWGSPAGSAGVETRASLPPESCSPFVGFRPVIAKKSAAAQTG